MDRFQQSTATLFNRYAEVFRVLRASVEMAHGPSLRGADLRILSFGCSTGAEMLTARAYFPDATILGCDVDETALGVAAEALEEDGGRVFASDAATIAALAPFDIVLANAVLCVHPLKREIEDLTPMFPHSRFHETVGTLVGALAPTAWLMLCNAAYDLRSVPEAAGLRPIASPLIEANGFVERFDRTGRRLTVVTKHHGQRRYDHRPTPHATESGGLDDRALRDCLYVVGGDPALADPEVGAAAGPLHNGELVLGLDPARYAPEGRVAAGLYGAVVPGALHPLMRREWRKSTVAGEIVALGPWDVPGGRPLPQAHGFVSPPAKASKLMRLFGWPR
ncbi:MAG: class I SAM-dependent methyltransferase [Pseudomonadota bacterium]